MKPTRPWIWIAAVVTAALGGCVTPPQPYDYTAFNRAKPATLLVMPPLNDAPDIKGTPGVWAQTTLPLSEAGYYVLPVTLVDETFRQNGVTTSQDAQEIPLPKLRQFFGADAALYIRIKKYGTSYMVVSSDTRVEIEGRLVDLRSGELLWQGTAWASSEEQRQTQGGGLAGLLVSALVNQIVSSATDASYQYAGIADQRLLSPRVNGVLPGPRSPHYGKPPATAR
jgi:hypothetical protein